MFRLKLNKGLSYDNGKIHVRADNPYVEVETETEAKALADSGYFELDAATAPKKRAKRKTNE